MRVDPSAALTAERLERLVASARQAPASVGSVAEFLTATAPPSSTAAAAFTEPTALIAAVARAARADRLGFAFAVGYRAAVQALVPALRDCACLCVTESGGGHPRAISTRLTPSESGFRVDGQKRWATLADHAENLLVVASRGVDGAGRNQLVAVSVAARAPGVTLTPLSQTRFVPEIGHFQVDLDGVAVAADAIVPGDGYLDVVKPFRTIEDLYVTATTAGHVLGIALRHGLAAALVERALGVVVGADALAALPPASPAVHLALAGLGHQSASLVADFGAALAKAAAAAQLPADVGERWIRDAPLLAVAQAAREARLAAAWRSLGQPG
jgi:alkylation response protein AidB-like acyl-CoA dehydrogenase